MGAVSCNDFSNHSRRRPLSVCAGTREAKRRPAGEAKPAGLSSGASLGASPPPWGKAFDSSGKEKRVGMFWISIVYLLLLSI